MKNWKNLSKRGLSMLLVISMVMSMACTTAFAAAQPEPDRTATVTVVNYPSVDRTSAEITYELPEKYSDVRLICLVDKTAGNPAAATMFNLMSGKSGLCRDSGTVATTIGYDYGTYTSPGLINELGETIGTGQSNEVVALEAALDEVNSSDPGKQLVVLWVPSTNMDARRSADVKAQITAALNELEAAIDAKGGRLVIWQYAEQPSRLLKDAGTSSATTEIRSDTDGFAAKVDNWLEQVLTDRTLDFTVTFSTTGTLATGITGITSSLGTTRVNGDGTVTVSVPKLYDHQGLKIKVTVALNEEIYPETVDVLTAETAGTRLIGLLDEDKGALPIFPNAKADRVLRTITFTGGDNAPASFEAPKALKALPGQLVQLPDESAQNGPGAAFGGWANSDVRYSPNQIVAMPETGMALAAQWGHIEVELQVTGVTTPEPPGNQMAEVPVKDYPLPLTSNCNYTSIVVDDVELPFEGTRSAKSVGSTTVNNKTYTAVFMGATENDQVIGYVDSGKLHIAGPGGVKAPENCSQLFYASSSSDRTGRVTSINLINFDTSETTNMSEMFYKCSKLTTLTLGDRFDTSRVTDMSKMFYDCEVLKPLNVSGFNTSKVTDMSCMFYYCEALTSLDVSKFDTSNVTNMSGMFSGCSNLKSLDVSGFDTGEVTDMGGMFGNCRRLTTLNVSGFDTGNVTSMGGMFNGCDWLTSLDLRNFDTSKVTGRMSYMFSNCGWLTSLDLSSFDTSNVTDMGSMFENCYGLTSLDLSSFDTSNVTNMYKMFKGCSSLRSLNLSSFNTEKVKDMKDMFYYCPALTSLDLSSFDTSNVTDMNGMFYYCSSLTTLDVSSFNTEKVVMGMNYMFYNCSSLTTLDVSGFKTNVMNLGNMFHGCSKLTFLDVSGFNTKNAWNMNSMFKDCSALKELKLGDNFYLADSSYSGLHADNYRDSTYWYSPFSGCTSLKAVEGFRLLEKYVQTNPYALTLGSFFSGCTALERVTFIPAEGGTTMNVSSLAEMFYNCPSLKYVDMHGWNLPNLSSVQNMFYGSGRGNLTIDMSWSGLNVANNMVTTGIATGMKASRVTLIVGDNYIAGGTDAHSQSMQQIIKAFPSSKTTVVGGSAAPASAAQAPAMQAAPAAMEAPASVEQAPAMEAPASIEQAPAMEAPASVEETPGMQAAPVVEEPPVEEPPVENVLYGSAGDDNGSKEYTETDLVGENPNYRVPMVTAKVPTPVKSVVTYKVVIRYVGDPGVQSETISVRYPLPSNVAPEGDGSITVGGPDCDHEWVSHDFKLEGNVLTGTVSGLFAGESVEVSVTCKLDKLNEPKDENDYYYWDGAAYAQTDSEAVTSNTVRLWYKEADEDEEPEQPANNDVVVKYEYLGDVPAGVTPPASKTAKVGETVTHVQPEVPDGYTFLGWEQKDGASAEGYTTTDADVETGVTFYGRWKAPEPVTYTVTYVFPEGCPSGFSIPAITVPAGSAHTVVKLAEDIAPYYTFNGWELDDKTTHQGGETIIVNNDITLIAQWKAHTGTIKFDGNAGTDTVTGDLGDITVILAKPEGALPGATREHYTFKGWALDKDATAPDYEAGANVSIFVGNGLNKDGDEITLYAVWEAEAVEYTVKHLDKDTDEVLAGPYTFTGKYGATVVAQAVDLSDRHYKLASGEESSQELTLDADNKEVTFYYAKFSEEDAVKLTIQLEYAYTLDGVETTAYESVETTDYIIDGSITISGTQYSVHDGKTYELTGAKVGDTDTKLEDNGNLIFMAEKGKEYTVTLTYELEENTLTVKYEDESGKQIKDPVTKTCKTGSDYDASDLKGSISGYTFKEVRDGKELAGTISEKTEITLVYTKNSVTPRPGPNPGPGPVDPDTDIDEPDVPLTELPDEPVETDEPDIPLTELPDEPVEVDEPDIPLTELPDEPVEDDEPDVPPTELPDEPVEDDEPDVPPTELPDEPVEVDEPDVPLTDVPQTGDNFGMWSLLAVVSAFGLVVLMPEKRKEQED